MAKEKEISILAEALFLALDNKEKPEQGLVIERLVKIMKDRKKGYLLPKIIKKLEKIYFQKKRVELSLAQEHSPETIQIIKEKIFEVFGKDKNIAIKTEKDLVGGFRAKTNNLLIKASVKDFLNEFKNYYR